MKILIAVDSLEFNKAIAQFVLKHNWQKNSKFKVIHVVDATQPYDPVTFMSFLESVAAQERHDAEALNSDMIDRIFSAEMAVEVHSDVLEGTPCDQIVQSAREWNADLIIVGSHGRKGLSRFTLGSVSASVVALAPCSVLVVRLPGSVKEQRSAETTQAASR